MGNGSIEGMNVLTNVDSQGKDVTVELLDERGLIAIQGPESSTALAAIAPKLGLDKMKFMTTAVTDVAGVENCRVTRCG